MTGSHPELEALLGRLGERTGLSFSPQLRDRAEMGIGRAMARANVADFTPYRRLLETDRRAFDDVVDELTVGETYFFREPGQFDFIRREVLPEIQQRRGREHVIRVWSAGCASGEEVYSLAILFQEAGLEQRGHFLGTDISPAALARARRAIYGSWSLRGEAPFTPLPYLQPDQGRYALEERIRRQVTFEYLNLALDTYPSFATGTWGMDLILCRNVLIYLDAGTIRQVTRRLLDSLVPGGWLITASSDPPMPADLPCETVVSSAGIFYRRRPEGLSPDTTTAESSVPVSGQLPGVDAPAPAAFSLPPRPRADAPGASSAELAPAWRVEARAALAQGDYTGAAQLAASHATDAEAWVFQVRALANEDTIQAEHVCAEAVARHPLATELHYLHAVLLLDLGRSEEAVRAISRVIYLDRSLAVAHLLMGSIAERRGDWTAARRAYRNAHQLCLSRPADQVVPFADGEPAGRLAEVAAAQLATLETPEEGPA